MLWNSWPDQCHQRSCFLSFIQYFLQLTRIVLVLLRIDGYSISFGGMIKPFTTSYPTNLLLIFVHVRKGCASNMLNLLDDDYLDANSQFPSQLNHTLVVSSITEFSNQNYISMNTSFFSFYHYKYRPPSPLSRAYLPQQTNYQQNPPTPNSKSQKPCVSSTSPPSLSSSS